MGSEVLRDGPGVRDAMGVCMRGVRGESSCWRWGLKKEQIWEAHQESKRDKKDRDAAGA